MITIDCIQHNSDQSRTQLQISIIVSVHTHNRQTPHTSLWSLTDFSHKGPKLWALMFSFFLSWTRCWGNSQDAVMLIQTPPYVLCVIDNDDYRVCFRLEPVGAASSDSLSGASNSSRQGDGSTEKLSSGSKARVHPMDKEKIEGKSCIKFRQILPNSSFMLRNKRPAQRDNRMQFIVNPCGDVRFCQISSILNNIGWSRTIYLKSLASGRCGPKYNFKLTIRNSSSLGSHYEIASGVCHRTPLTHWPLENLKEILGK